MIDFYVRGSRYHLTPQEVMDAVAGLEPDVIYSLAVWVNGRWWPAKQPFVAALGLRPQDVNSRTALRNLERLGFPSHDVATQGLLPSEPGAPGSASDVRARESALRLAVDLLQGRTSAPGDATGVAEQFLRWLTA